MMADERQKRQAQNAARRIPLPETCGRCGESGRIYRHHPDYAKPLVVQFLCARCHARTHREMASYRPPKRPKGLTLALTDQERQDFGKAADEAGLPLSVFIRLLAVNALKSGQTVGMAVKAA
jgi:hypothetical protein